MRKMIVGNFKMEMIRDEVVKYIKEFQTIITDLDSVVICPSFIHLPLFNPTMYTLGAQDVSKHESGAYTGEVSAKQIHNSGFKYVIVGHSERRKYFAETDTIVHDKILRSLKEDLSPIVCIGETQEERSLKMTEKVLQDDVDILFRGYQSDEVGACVIAYEPVWAIGTGLTPTPEEINSTAAFIKSCVKQNKNVDIKVLYGGSVSIKNIESFLGLENVDGFLIGKASTDPVQFAKMIEITRK
jgi:triosephosphate isomerase (TIM)